MPAATTPPSSRRLVKIPDVKPITLGVFVLTETGVEVTGRATYENYEGALEFAKRAHRSSGFWLADLLLYGDSRQDWTERLEAAHDATGLSLGTLKNVRAVGKAIALPRRRAKVEFSLHVEVAHLTAPEQDYWLKRAEEEDWSVRELRLAIKDASRSAVLDGRSPSMWTVEVTVQVEVESINRTRAQDRAWDDVKHALVNERTMKVIGAQARPR